MGGRPMKPLPSLMVIPPCALLVNFGKMCGQDDIIRDIDMDIWARS